MAALCGVLSLLCAALVVLVVYYGPTADLPPLTLSAPRVGAGDGGGDGDGEGEGEGASLAGNNETLPDSRALVHSSSSQ